MWDFILEQNKNNFKKVFETLFAIALIGLSTTQLRAISGSWPSEFFFFSISMISIAMYAINKIKLSTKSIPTILFLFIFILLAICGLLVSNFYQSDTKAIDFPAIRDIVAYSLCFIGLTASASLFGQSKLATDFVNTLINILLTGLLLISIFLSLFGFENLLWYEDTRYRFLSENPNQLALYIASVPFLILASEKQRPLGCTFLAIKLTILLIAGFFTKSDALFLSWFCAIILYFDRLIGFKERKLFYFGAVILLALFAFKFQTEILQKVNSTFLNQDSQINVRLELWKSAITKGIDSLFVGWGPGLHARANDGTLNESHNIFVEIFVSTGLLGLASFVILTGYIWKKTKKDIHLRAAFLAIIIFSLFHSTLRHPIFWIVILIINTLSTSDNHRERTRSAI